MAGRDGPSGANGSGSESRQTVERPSPIQNQNVNGNREGSTSRAGSISERRIVRPRATNPSRPNRGGELAIVVGLPRGRNDHEASGSNSVPRPRSVAQNSERVIPGDMRVNAAVVSARQSQGPARGFSICESRNAAGESRGDNLQLVQNNMRQAMQHSRVDQAVRQHPLLIQEPGGRARQDPVARGLNGAFRAPPDPCANAPKDDPQQWMTGLREEDARGAGEPPFIPLAQLDATIARAAATAREAAQAGLEQVPPARRVEIEAHFKDLRRSLVEDNGKHFRPSGMAACMRQGVVDGQYGVAPVFVSWFRSARIPLKYDQTGRAFLANVQGLPDDPPANVPPPGINPDNPIRKFLASLTAEDIRILNEVQNATLTTPPVAGQPHINRSLGAKLRVLRGILLDRDDEDLSPAGIAAMREANEVNNETDHLTGETPLLLCMIKAEIPVARDGQNVPYLGTYKGRSWRTAGLGKMWNKTRKKAQEEAVTTAERLPYGLEPLLHLPAPRDDYDLTYRTPEMGTRFKGLRDTLLDPSTSRFRNSGIAELHRVGIRDERGCISPSFLFWFRAAGIPYYNDVLDPTMFRLGQKKDYIPKEREEEQEPVEIDPHTGEPKVKQFDLHLPMPYQVASPTAGNWLKQLVHAKEPLLEIPPPPPLEEFSVSFPQEKDAVQVDEHLMHPAARDAMDAAIASERLPEKPQAEAAVREWADPGQEAAQPSVPMDEDGVSVQEFEDNDMNVDAEGDIENDESEVPTFNPVDSPGQHNAGNGGEAGQANGEGAENIAIDIADWIEWLRNPRQDNAGMGGEAGLANIEEIDNPGIGEWLELDPIQDNQVGVDGHNEDDIIVIDDDDDDGAPVPQEGRGRGRARGAGAGRARGRGRARGAGRAEGRGHARGAGRAQGRGRGQAQGVVIGQPFAKPGMERARGPGIGFERLGRGVRAHGRHWPGANIAGERLPEPQRLAAPQVLPIRIYPTTPGRRNRIDRRERLKLGKGMADMLIEMYPGDGLISRDLIRRLMKARGQIASKGLWVTKSVCLKIEGHPETCNWNKGSRCKCWRDRLGDSASDTHGIHIYKRMITGYTTHFIQHKLPHVNGQPQQFVWSAEHGTLLWNYLRYRGINSWEMTPDYNCQLTEARITEFREGTGLPHDAIIKRLEDYAFIVTQYVQALQNFVAKEQEMNYDQNLPIFREMRDYLGLNPGITDIDEVLLSEKNRCHRRAQKRGFLGNVNLAIMDYIARQQLKNMVFQQRQAMTDYNEHFDVRSEALITYEIVKDTRWPRVYLRNPPVLPDVLPPESEED